MSIVKLPLIVLQWLAAPAFCGCLLFTYHFLLQGVAQLGEAEGLAKQPETAEELRHRMQIVFALLSVALGSSLVIQAAWVFSGPRLGMIRLRVRKALFVGFFSWAVVCLFYCLLILAGSFKARWEVDRIYYWLAGGAGAMALVLLGAANFFADLKSPGSSIVR
jgi:FtsH-binding integral membrane protein